VHPLVRCQAGQAATVQVDAVVTDQIGVFVGVHAVGRKPNLAGFLIQFQNISDVPFTLGDLTFYLAGGPVVNVEMVPVVPFAHPNNFLTVFQVITVLAVVVDVGVAGFFNEATHRSG